MNFNFYYSSCKLILKIILIFACTALNFTNFKNSTILPETFWFCDLAENIVLFRAT